jgi:hypothetical protein
LVRYDVGIDWEIEMKRRELIGSVVLLVAAFLLPWPVVAVDGDKNFVILHSPLTSHTKNVEDATVRPIDPTKVSNNYQTSKHSI